MRRRIRLTESEFKRVISNTVRRILRESDDLMGQTLGQYLTQTMVKNEEPDERHAVGYYVASFGDEKSDRHMADKLYRELENEEVSPDEVIDALIDILYINSDNLELGYHKELPKDHILGYSRDERFFLTYSEDSHRFDIWATDEE